MTPGIMTIFEGHVSGNAHATDDAAVQLTDSEKSTLADAGTANLEQSHSKHRSHEPAPLLNEWLHATAGFSAGPTQHDFCAQSALC